MVFLYNFSLSTQKKIHLLWKVVSENRNPDWDSDYTLAWLKVWKQAAKRHTQWENSQQKNVQIKSEKDETQMFRELAEIGCETKCEQKKKRPRMLQNIASSKIHLCSDGVYWILFIHLPHVPQCQTCVVNIYTRKHTHTCLWLLVCKISVLKPALFNPHAVHFIFCKTTASPLKPLFRNQPISNAAPISVYAQSSINISVLYFGAFKCMNLY